MLDHSNILRFLTIYILLCFQTGPVFGQTSLKSIDLDYGNYAVGFRHYISVDSSRTYQRLYDWNLEYHARPIPISIWYPSIDKAVNTTSLTILDYMEILKQEEEWEHLPNDQILNWFYYRNTQENQNHLKESTHAFSNLNIAKGKFPVVLYAPSYQASSIENFVLCEYLASHGYLVISSPSRGSETRFLEGGTSKDLETQTRDIEFILQEVTKNPHADLDQISTMGFSFGGLSNVLAQMRNPQIKAVVSLDGSIKYLYPVIKESPFFNLDKFNVPFIHFAQKEIPEQVIQEDQIDAKLNHDFTFYDSIQYSKAYKLRFHNLTHSSFSSLGVLFEQRDLRQDKSDLEIIESYKLVALYCLNFLNATLKNNTKALKFLKNRPEENGIETGIISHQSKPAKKTPFSFENFNELASRQKYHELIDLYQSLHKKHPDLKLEENKLNNLGLQLVFNPKRSEHGIRIFQFAIWLYPNSANLFDSLAEGYLFIGNKNKAKENFQKSLQLNQQNQNAIDRLNQMK